MAAEPEPRGDLRTPDQRRTIPDGSVIVHRWDPVTNTTIPVVLGVTVAEVIPDLSRHEGPLHPFVEAEIAAFAGYIEGVKAEAAADPTGDAAKRVARFQERRSEANAAGTPFGIGEILGAFAAPLETDQNSTT